MEKKNEPELTPLEQKVSKYREDGYNVLLPSQSIQQFGQFHEPSIEVVQLETDEDSGDVYVQSWMKDGQGNSVPKTYSLAKPGLLKLATCAGIVWDPVNTKRVDDGHDKKFCCYQAVGMLQRSDGRWITLKNMYEVDLEVIEEELYDLYKRKCRDWNRGDRSEADFVEYLKQWVADSVRRELLKKRKHKLRLAESGAMMAVIRSLLAIKSHYTKVELSKPFVVPRVVFNPDTSDPEIRAAILTQGKKAIASAYGEEWDEKFPSTVPIEVPALTETTPAVDDEDYEFEAKGADDRPVEQPPEEPAETKTPEGMRCNSCGEYEGNHAKDCPDGDPGPSQPPEEPEKKSQPFEEPKRKLGQPITKLDEFRLLKGNTEGIEKALRDLMERVKYDESKLTDSRIGLWKWDYQEQFFNVLIDQLSKVEA